jgi:cytochrome P450
VTPEHVQAMPFLKCVLKEALRLHPPVPVFSRETTQVGERPVPRECPVQDECPCRLLP